MMTRLAFRNRTVRQYSFTFGLLILVIAGCTPSPNQSPENSRSVGGKAPRNAEEALEQAKETQCSDLLNSLLGQFVNPAVVLNFDSGQTLSLLNQWGRTCKGPSVTPSSSDISRWEEVAGPAVADSIQESIYGIRDVDHLQSCVWMSIVKQHETEGLSDDLDRVRALFHYVVRNVSLVSEHQEGTPFSVNGMLFSGQGTVQDRTWLFAELLKQLKIDVLLISPERTTESEGPVVPRLIGVLLRDECRLFDPELGIAVPAMPEKIVPGNTYEIATLSNALKNPELLTRLSLPDRPYPLNAETLQKAEYHFYGHAGWWPTRHAELSEYFLGPTQAEIFDGLTDLKERRGVLSRIQEASEKHLSGKPVKFWNYAEDQLTRRQNLSALQQQVISRMVEIFQYPYVQELQDKDEMGTFDDPTNANAKRRERKQNNPPKPSGDYFRARGMQILGASAEGVRLYMHNQRNSRIFQDFDDPRALQNAAFSHLRDLHGQVMNDSTYWIGICKLEQNIPDSQRIATDKFSQYVREYPEGEWCSASYMKLAILAAQERKFAQAVEYLKKIPETDPLSPNAKWLIKEWHAPAVESPPSAEPNSESSPVGPDKSESKTSEAGEAKPDSEQDPKNAEQNTTEEKIPAAKQAETSPSVPKTPEEKP